MDLKTTKASPVLADPSSSPISKSRLGMHSSLMPYSQSGTSFSSTILTIPRKKPAKLDDVRSNGWLDAMKSSSPPRKKILKDPFSGVSSDDGECAYQSWQMRCAVKSVAKHFPTTIISGRRRDMVSELVGLTELYYAGSHGMDIKFPVRDTAPASFDHLNSDIFSDQQDKEVNLFQPAREFLPMIDEVFRTLVKITSDITGAIVENHKFCTSVHYRNVDEKSWETVAQRVHDVLKDYPRLRLTHGRKVLEVRPVIDWNKGKAVEFLLKSMNFGNSEDVLPIYIGDDKTDEDAFKVLRQGNRGYGILVSSTPKESKAFFSLKDPEQVKEFLKSLVRWKKSML